MSNVPSGQYRRSKCPNLNCVERADPKPRITSGTNVTGYMCWRGNSSLTGAYPTNGTPSWYGNSGWWIIETLESYNGIRGDSSSYQGFFLQWFSTNAFGGTNYENTPVAAVSHTHEPGGGRVSDPATYFGLWASGKIFAICAWNSRRTEHFQAVGDPFVRR